MGFWSTGLSDWNATGRDPVPDVIFLTPLPHQRSGSPRAFIASAHLVRVFMIHFVNNCTNAPGPTLACLLISLRPCLSDTKQGNAAKSAAFHGWFNSAFHLTQTPVQLFWLLPDFCCCQSLLRGGHPANQREGCALDFVFKCKAIGPCGPAATTTEFG